MAYDASTDTPTDTPTVDFQSARRVVVAMSGGVDSSVAALLLQREGYTVTGVTFKLFDDADRIQAACVLKNAQDIRDAHQVACDLGIDHITIDVADLFDQKVIEPFCCAYECGDTPNPCIDCNRFIKFATLRQIQNRLGYDFIATGHYARRVYDEQTGRYLLKCAHDVNKDQSYVLYRLTQSDLAHLLLPIGGLSKSDVRRLARKAGFTNARKQESQDICFIPDDDYAAFIERRREATLEPGRIMDTDGNVVGMHNGLARYTIGQRKGLGIAASEPLYVLGKNETENIIVVGPQHMLLTREVRARDINFIAGEPPEDSDTTEGRIRVSAKTGYRQCALPAWAQYSASASSGGELLVIFDEPVVAPAAGQSIVLYDEDNVVGGGTIFGNSIVTENDAA